MDLGLVASAALLGLAGAPHCSAMCSAPCSAAIGRGGPGTGVAFHFARIASYAAGGAFVASSISALASWSEFSPALRPLWTLINAATLVLGAWLLWRGRQPAWLARVGRVPMTTSRESSGWQTLGMPVRAAGAGLAWVAWPCGLLQSALVVAALASNAVSGATVMTAFAIASAPGLAAGPWLARLLLSSRGSRQREIWAVRLAGVMMGGASAWSLGHLLGPQVAAFCRSL